MLQVSTNAVELNDKTGAGAANTPQTVKNRLLSAFNQVMAIGLDGISNSSLQKQIRLTNLMAISTLCLALLCLPVAAFLDNFYWLNTTLAMVFTCVMVVGLNALGKTTLSRVVYMVGLNISLFLSALFVGPTAQMEGFLILSVIIPFLICDLSEVLLLAMGALLPIALFYTVDFAAPYFTRFNLLQEQQVMIYKVGMAMQFALILMGIYQAVMYGRKRENELKESQKIIAMQEGELKRNRMETEQLAYAISHDLRAPVRNITSFMNLLSLKHAPALNPEAKEFINYTTTGSKRMERLIEDIVAYYRLDMNLPAVTTVNMNDLVTRVKVELNGKVKNAMTAISVSGSLPMVNKVHAPLMQQLLKQLISNGMKFNKSENPEVVIGGTETAEGYSFWVKDNGIGILQQHATAIYLIFKRLHAETEYDGIGAGLAICKKIVDFYHGDIWFESEPGKGTTFHFTLKK